MSKSFSWLTSASFLIALSAVPLNAQDAFPPRQVLGEQIQTDEFRQIVQAICNPATELTPDSNLARSDIYFRLTERKYAVSADNKLNTQAALGGSPYVFLTVPQVGFGRSLYGVYSDLGYDAEGVLQQRGKHMVALVIRYDSEIKFSPERNGLGSLRNDDFDQYVYVPTWRNGFRLFSRLASEAPDPKNPAHMTFQDDADRDMARYFPADRRQHLAELPYPLLRMAGGPDWEYRQLLENKMGMNSHFRGVGITENTLSPADNRTGVPEFVGPNRRLADLIEYAVIDFGRMEFTEVHD
ncbi:MAG: hypothetical protein KDA88_12880 [Planctomycetaceae bacterium]|nr:hypothetical protein [Planctomycetaceae bacterium]MCB9951798.1 hypothetical protein [Planctomycetaceae bacterium]